MPDCWDSSPGAESAPSLQSCGRSPQSLASEGLPAFHSPSRGKGNLHAIRTESLMHPILFSASLWLQGIDPRAPLRCGGATRQSLLRPHLAKVQAAALRAL